VQASLDYKQRLQQLFLPEGIAYDGIGSIEPARRTLRIRSEVEAQ
jgi:hypothetical protein